MICNKREIYVWRKHCSLTQLEELFFLLRMIPHINKNIVTQGLSQCWWGHTWVEQFLESKWSTYQEIFEPSTVFQGLRPKEICPVDKVL